MPRTCTVCTHPEVDAIDRALVAGEAFRVIAERTGTSPTALFRHKAEHLPVLLLKATEAAEVARADDLLGQLRELQVTTLRILDTAEKTGKLTPAVLAIGQARQNIELMAKLMGELQQEGTINIVSAPEYLHVRTLIVSALAPFPEARLAVADALQRSEA